MTAKDTLHTSMRSVLPSMVQHHGKLLRKLSCGEVRVDDY